MKVEENTASSAPYINPAQRRDLLPHTGWVSPDYLLQAELHTAVIGAQHGKAAGGAGLGQSPGAAGWGCSGCPGVSVTSKAPPGFYGRGGWSHPRDSLSALDGTPGSPKISCSEERPGAPSGMNNKTLPKNRCTKRSVKSTFSFPYRSLLKLNSHIEIS